MDTLYKGLLESNLWLFFSLQLALGEACQKSEKYVGLEGGG